MNNIYINGRFLSQKVTGVQRFAIETTKKIAKLAQNDNKNIIILCPSNSNFNPFSSSQNVKIEFIGKKNGYYWEQIELAKYCKKNKIKGLLNLCNLAPIRLKDNNIVIHDIRVLQHPKEFSILYRYLIKYFTKKNVKKAKNIFTVSNFSKFAIENYYNLTDVTVVYSGVDHINGDNENQKQEDFFLSVGSLEPNKNFKYILEFAKKHPEYKFKVVGGKGKAFANVDYEQLTNVEFLGYVSDSELKSLYSMAKGFIFPSFYEGFGLPPMEAISLGTKVVYASDIDVLHEIYADILTYFNPNDVNSLELALNNPHIITEDERTALLEKYTWEKTAYKIYEKIKG